jgi:hypothetical protein
MPTVTPFVIAFPASTVTAHSKTPGVAPAVKSPELVIVPTPLDVLHTGVKGTSLPRASTPTAVSCCVPFGDNMIALGVMRILSRGSGRGGPTLILALPVRFPLLASIVFVNSPRVNPAVNRPELLIVPPPATTDQVGDRVTELPLASRPAAKN